MRKVTDATLAIVLDENLAMVAELQRFRRVGCLFSMYLLVMPSRSKLQLLLVLEVSTVVAT